MRTLVSLFFLALTGCGGGGIAPQPDFASIDIDIPPADSYDSAAGTFRREMCWVDDVSTPFRFTQKQLHDFGAIAERSDFFSLPTRIPGLGTENPGMDTIVIVSPCFDSRLRLRYRGRVNDVTWGCAFDGSSTPPVQVSKLYSAVVKAIRSSPSVKQLPDADCGYH